MRELREEYLDVVQWTINDNNINRQIIDAAKAASAVEDALDSLQNVLSPYGGLSFSSQQEEVKRVTDIVLVMDDCRKYLADEYREYIDGPLRKRFNTLMDELATVDVKNFRVKNTLGIKGVEYRGKEHLPFETEVAELTLSDYVGLGIGTMDSQGIRHTESVSDMAELFEKEYNYYIEANILDESVGLKEFLESYIPREFMYAKDASDVQKVLQSVWEGLVISRYIDSARGKTLITQDNLTTSEAEMNGVIGTVDLVFTVTGAGIYTKTGSGSFLKGMFLATSENMMANATFTTMDNAGYGEYGVATWLCMEVVGAYFLHRLGKGNGSGVDELLEPKKNVNEEVFLESDGSSVIFNEPIEVKTNKGIEVEFTNPYGNKISWVEQNTKNIPNSIESAKMSDIPGKIIEGKVAEFVQQKTGVTQFGLEILCDNKRVTDLDVVTNTQIVEVKKSASALKEEQIKRLIDPYDLHFFNYENKEVIVYIEETIEGITNPHTLEKLKYLEDNQIIVVNSLEELEGVLK